MRLGGPPAEEPAQMLDPGAGGVHRAVALQLIVFQVGARHHVKGQWRALGHWREI